MTGGTVQCWGRNDRGQIGNGTTGGTLPPTPVSGLSDATSLGANTDYACAVRAAGPTVCWGSDDQEQLGDGPGLTEQSTPVPVLPL